MALVLIGASVQSVNVTVPLVGRQPSERWPNDAFQRRPNYAFRHMCSLKHKLAVSDNLWLK